jgi:hypothetical protein
MSARDLLQLIRQEPQNVILELGEMLDELRADMVDARFAAAVEAGAFDGLAARALAEHAAGKTVPLDEVLHQH